MMSFIICGTFLGGMILVNNSVLQNTIDLSHYEKWVVAGGMIGFVLFFTENITDAGLSRTLLEMVGSNHFQRISHKITFNQGASIASLFLWPFALVIFRRFGMATAILIIGFCIAAILIGETIAPIIATIFGLIAFSLVVLAGRLGPKILLGIIVIYTMLVPALPSFLPDPRDSESSITRFYSSSDFHRFIIWNTAVEHIEEKPLLGGGLDTTRALYSNKDMTQFQAVIKSTGKKLSFVAEPIPLHPHNAFLQLWIELGVVGAGLLAILLFEILRRMQRSIKSRWEAAAGYGLFVTGVTVSSLSYGIWQSWWLGSLFLAAASMAAAIKNSPN